MSKSLLLLTLISYLNATTQPALDKVKVFVDCSQTYICNSDYIRTEITMVDFVRDRHDADVHVLVTTQRSDAGGIKVQLDFIGLRSFIGVSDTLNFFNDPTSTEDEQRKTLVQQLKLGLIR